MPSPSLSPISCKNFSQLKQFHAQIIVQSLHQRNFWLSNLLTHCANLRTPLSYARFLFNSAPNPNVILFTAMIKIYSQSNAHHEAISLFQRMQNSGIKPDAFVFPVLIRSITAMSGKKPIGIHGQILKLGHHSDQFVQNSIMDMYAKMGPIDTARQMFDEMSERNIADWNSMISGYWKWGKEVEARQVFDLMPQRNTISWTAMVSGYAKHGDLENARKLFDEMPERNVVSWNAMLTGYAQKGFEGEVFKLFENMMDSGVQPDETTMVTVISACSKLGDLRLAESLVQCLDHKKIKLNYFVKTALIDMYAKCGNLETAHQIFNGMSDRNQVSWNAMISAYARSGDLSSARELFDKMPERNVVSWNSMISGYAQNGLSATAIDLFRAMEKAEGLQPDEVTMTSIISACGHLGALDLGKWVVNFMTANQIKPSISVYNSLIFMYSRCGSMKDATKLFFEMPERDIVSYNSLIAGFAVHGKGEEALGLLSRMREEGKIKPDRITFIGVLTACSHAGLLDEGRRIFRSIEIPTVDHYACMIDLLGRAGKLDEAQQLLQEMQTEPHAGLWGALLNASRIHGQIELGEIAANKLFKLEPENAGNYVLLSNIYAAARRWDDVEKMRRLMRERGVRKTTGCSWVEFGQKIHRFIVGDRSHERSDEIYAILEELGKKMKDLGYVADKSWVLRDVEEEEKEELVGTHSEKLAIGFGLLVSEAGKEIRVVKNLRVCGDCHFAIKIISNLVGREIIVRDNNRFHSFKDGSCSCKDYW